MVHPQMLKCFIASIILLGGIFCGVFHSADSSQNIFLATAGLSRAEQVKMQLEQNFTLDRHRSVREWNKLVQAVIFQANPRLDGLTHQSINQLSREVVRVSQCYGIDPGIYSALIWRESNFRPQSTSERGAAGLTQMTRLGIREVLERVMQKSPRKLQHLRTLVHKCNPLIYERLPGTVSADIVTAWKNSVLMSDHYALMMGAVLLKLNLAHVRPAKSYVDESMTNEVVLRDLYRQALQKYNGDPKVKMQFAVDVLQLGQRVSSPTQLALSDSKFLMSIGRF